MIIRNTILAAFAATALGCAYGLSPTDSARTAEVETGTAPAFSLPATNGKTVDLNSFKGKYVVLEWTNNGCPYVRRHYGTGNMQKLQAWAKEKDVVWLSIVSSGPGKQGHVSPEEGAELVKAQRIQSAFYLLDSDGKVGKAYGAKTSPHMFVIDPKGAIIYNGAIDDQPNGDAKTANNYVRAALEEAMAGKPVSVPTSQPYGCGIKY
jgi:peroxiredoxin